MAHLHLPDGVLPWYWWVAGYAGAGVILLLVGARFRRTLKLTALARAGFFAALMVLAMSVHLAPLGYHLNLATLAGIVAGPAGGFLACFLANVFLALMGHGGVTVVGLNTLTVGGQAVAAWAGWRALAFVKAPWPRAFVASFAALAVGTALAFAVVAAGTRDFGAVTDRLERGKIVDFHLGGERYAEGHTSAAAVSLGRLAALMFGLGGIGALVEAAVTASIVTYLAQAAPRLLG
jgi:cobalt/nickel transport system permease protein